MLKDWRIRFRNFCGADRFTAFAHDFHIRAETSNRRLPFEVELRWEEFTLENLDVPSTVETLEAILCTCPLHLNVLLNDTVPAIYGFGACGPADYEPTKAFFPLANSVYVGGCIVEDESKTRRVLYCDQCRIAERAWLAEHPPDDSFFDFLNYR